MELPSSRGAEVVSLPRAPQTGDPPAQNESCQGGILSCLRRSSPARQLGPRPQSRSGTGRFTSCFKSSSLVLKFPIRNRIAGLQQRSEIRPPPRALRRPAPSPREGGGGRRARPLITLGAVTHTGGCCATPAPLRSLGLRQHPAWDHHELKLFLRQKSSVLA